MIMLEYVFKTIYVSIYKISKMFFLSSEIQNSNVPYCCVKVYFESHETIYIVLKRIRLIFLGNEQFFLHRADGWLIITTFGCLQIATL